MMRLDWFLPTLRSDRPGNRRRYPGRIRAFGIRVLPRFLFSDHHRMRRGLARRVLVRMGPVWAAAPVRRLIQSSCLVIFLYLFFWVCWPYSAEPVAPSTGWNPAEFDYERATVSLSAGIDSASATEMIDGASALFVTDQSNLQTYGVAEDRSRPDDGAEPESLIRVAATSPGRLTLDLSALPADQIDELSVSTGPWDLSSTGPDHWPGHYSTNLQQKEQLDAEFFLIIDPLVSLSTAVASRSWVWSLAAAGGILAVCLVIPRGFCGYICPLGTTIDLFDWAVGRHVRRFRVAGEGWWVHIRFYLLLGVMIAAGGGVLLSGYVSAIPVITRGLLFTLAPLQNGAANGWHQIPGWNSGHLVSVLLFPGVLGLGLLRPRFWCKYVCPSGAVFSVANLFRLSERKVDSSCIHCNKCVEICPFDAIKPDFTTRTSDCTLCQSCGGVCPTHSIHFTGRLDFVELKTPNDPPTLETALGRRGFLSAAVGTGSSLAGGVFTALAIGGGETAGTQTIPVRPPGSVPESSFLQMCIRCGECFKACPSDVLQPMGFEQGLNSLWTPEVVADWAGCASSCNACGQVCPTGAISALPLEEKRYVRMGLAVINSETCLPLAGRGACQLCVDECTAAGYNALEFIQTGTQVDEQGNPVAGSGFLAPYLLPDLCVGCGLCQTRCYGINVADRGVLKQSSIVIEAGEGREDRLLAGSWRELAQQRMAR